MCKYGNNRQGQGCRGPCLPHEEYRNGKCECKFGLDRGECRLLQCKPHEEYRNGKCECKYGLDQGRCRLCPMECKSKGGCVKRGKKNIKN